MKVGDKLMCKKDFISKISSKVIYMKDSLYKIDILNGGLVEIEIGKNGTSRRFSINDSINFFVFSEYFYTKVEYRKLKIQKILE